MNLFLQTLQRYNETEEKTEPDGIKIMHFTVEYLVSYIDDNLQ